MRCPSAASHISRGSGFRRCGGRLNDRKGISQPVKDTGHAPRGTVTMLIGDGRGTKGRGRDRVDDGWWKLLIRNRDDGHKLARGSYFTPPSFKAPRSVDPEETLGKRNMYLGNDASPLLW